MEKNKKASLRVSLIGLLVSSLLFVGILSTIIGCVNLKKGMEVEVEKGVLATCGSYAQVLDYTYDGETVDESLGLENDMKKETGYDYTFFVGDTRVRSSISGVVGTKASDAVIDAVINKKQNYQASGVVINGNPYYVAYIPLTDESGSVYGMAFVGLEQSEITQYIITRVIWIVVMALATMIVFTVIGVIFTLKITEAIDENVKAVGMMANGDLNVSISDKVKSRKDELGEMSNALSDMAERIRSVIGNARLSSDEVDQSADYL